MAEIISEMIEFPSNGHTTPGYLVQPKEDGKYPGVVVLQEWWGLNSHIKDVAERFAKEGFVALAPDLYHGEVAEEPDEARKLAMALDRERAILECSSAAKYLNELPNTGSGKAGVVGWCMGGGLSLSTAAHNGHIGASVVFYGRPLEAADTAKLTVPVLGLYGEEDAGIPVSLVKDFETELQNNDVTHEIHIYEGAQHAFFNETRENAYHPDAAADAWKKTLGWFRKFLI